MNSLRRFCTRLFNFTARQRGDERLREEMESHVAFLTDEYVRSGMTPEEARRRARLSFGSIETISEDYRAEESLPFMENLFFDVRYALRVLRKSPAFTLVALITLMLGIGANTVVFGVLNAILLQSPHVSDPQNLYQLRHKAWASGRLLTSSYPAFEDFQRRSATFSGLAAINAYSHADLRWQNTVISLSGDEVSGNYFDVLGVQPAAGSFFHAADEHGPDSVPCLVISDALWRRAFHADPHIIGTTVEMNRHPFTVIGIASPQFHGTERFSWPDYWIPMLNEEQLSGSDYLRSRASIDVTIIGRLKPGVTLQQATDDLNAISAQLAKEYPATDEGLRLRLIHPGLFGDDGDVIRGFLVSVNLLAILVLLAACANLATLFAARAADRGRELAVRVALGSTRSRLVRQLLTEAVIVSLAGGAAGLTGAALLLKLLNRWEPMAEVHLAAAIDTRVFFAGLALTLCSAMLFGIAPARQIWRSSPLQAMKGGHTETAHLRRFALRDLLLGFQIAVCTLLITASLVAVRGMERTLHAPLGFQPQGAMLADIDLSQVESADGTAAVKEMLEASRSIPGVTAAGTVNRTPMTGGMHGVPVFPPGTTELKLDHAVLAPYVFTMSPGYLDAAGTRLLAGRDVSWNDTAKTPRVAIVNKTFAQKMWGEASVIGKRFIVQGDLTEVVGMAEDGKYHDLEELPQPVVYLPLLQNPDAGATFIVRSARPPGEMTAALEHAWSSIEPNAPITVQSWPDSLASEMLPARAATVALGVMGMLAAMLAATGIFGMATYTVSRRMKELGIRVALGARPMHIMRAAVGRPMLLLGAGSALGLLAGILAGRFLGRIVYQANPRDPVVIAGAMLAMALLGIAASTIPARRALAVDPSRLMREE